LTKKLSRCEYLKSKFFYAVKVAFVEGDDDIAARPDRQLQNHFVVGIPELGPPQVEDPMSPGNLAMKVDHIIDYIAVHRKLWFHVKENLFVLQNQRN